MRCGTGEDEGCGTCRGNKINNAKCWSKWKLCGRCAMKKYPQEYTRRIIRSHKEVHVYKELQKPGINGYQGIKIETVQ